MLPYTGGEPRGRHAILALNMQGGGGLEIWQYTTRTPEAPKFTLQLGDLGIYTMKFKCKNVVTTFEWMKSKGVELCSDIHKAPNGLDHFFFVCTLDLALLFYVMECLQAEPFNFFYIF